MPRAKIYGFIALLVSTALAGLFFYHSFYGPIAGGIFSSLLADNAYYAVAVPLGFLVLIILGTGFWIGWTILTIKVAPPMPEIVEKKDYAKPKAFLLCLVTLALLALFAYGVYLKSYWALALPAAVFTIVVLGMVFWVGLAIITTRATLPADKK